MESPRPSIKEEGLQLKNYTHIIRRRADVLILFFVATVSVITIGSFIMEPVYRATTTLLIDPESPNVLTTTGMVELESQNYFSYKEYYQSQAELLTSYTLVKKVFNEFGLEEQFEYFDAKEPIKKFLKTIKVEPVRDTRLLKLNVDNKDPELAAKIANRMANLYVMRNLYYISRTELTNLLKNEYLKLESRVSEYAKVYKEGHPEMIKVKNEMAELVAKIEKEKKSVYDYDNIEDYLKPEAQHQLAGFKANNISVQDSAEIPVVPIKPKRALNIVLAVVIGIMGGIGMAFFSEYLDDTAKSIEDVEEIAPWPFLGSVPRMKGRGKRAELEKDVRVQRLPRDPVSESYRSIRTSILFSSTEERPLRSVVVTSPGPQEGKTTTLCNLGISIAQNGSKALLVDADMRKPRLHEIFNIENKNGLSDFLCGRIEFVSSVKATDIEGLSITNGGTHPPNPSELLSSQKMKYFIQEAERKFDFLLFDSPPVGMLTDAMIFSSMVDGMIMVIESSKTSKRTLARIYKLINSAGVRVVGIVLNKISIHGDDYYHRYYRHYYGKP